MDSLTLLDQARSSGLIVRAEGSCLIVRGPRRLEALARQLLDAKPTLMPLLLCDRCGAASGRMVPTYWTRWRQVVCVPCAALLASQFDQDNTWPSAPWSDGEVAS